RQNGRILLRLDALEAQLERLGSGGERQAPQGLSPGETAPDFELPDLSGKPTTLAGWRGRHGLLMFFNPPGSFCEVRAGDLAALGPEGGEGRPVPLLITTGDPEENRRFMDEHGIRCPVLVQKADEILALYHAGAPPWATSSTRTARSPPRSPWGPE